MSAVRKAASLAFTGAAATATLGLAMGPALAVTAGTWHVKAPGKKAPFSLKAKNKGAVLFVDTTHAFNWTCDLVRLSGSAPKASVAATGSSTKLGALKNGTFNYCSAGGGAPLTVDLVKNAGIFGHSYKSGVNHGNIKSISLKISLVGFRCTMKAVGKLPMTYTNATHTLSLDPKRAASMTIKSPTTCPFVKNGDRFYFTGALPVSSPKSLTVSGP